MTLDSSSNSISISRSSDGIKKIQAIFRGQRCRDTHVKRAKEGSQLICPYARSSDSDDVINSMLKLGQCSSSDVVYDLGCGDGSILIAVATNHGSICYGSCNHYYCYHHHNHHHHHYHHQDTISIKYYAQQLETGQ